MGPLHRNIYTTGPETMTQKSSEKREQKDFKSQNNKKSAVKHSLLEMAT